MKLDSNLGQTIISEGAEASNSFRIARTPHMFNILSSGLYSDKIGAVLREVGCNAMDSHVMAGKPDLPIRVKLPSVIDPTLIIQDWGVGLDDSQARSLYTTYGWSNKQSSNEVTGAFGLGSKAPFAYTAASETKKDGFTVVACKDGIQRNYVCYIDETGAPVITRIGESEASADWQNGVMVKFNVRPEDIRTFENKAAQIFKWFSVPPAIEGLPPLSHPWEDPGLRKIVTPLGELAWEDEGGVGCSILTGNVCYPVDLKKVFDTPDAYYAGLFAYKRVIFKVDTGRVLMTPSRETLQYDGKTVKFLKDLVKSIVRQSRNELYARLDKALSMKAWPRAHEIALACEGSFEDVGMKQVFMSLLSERKDLEDVLKNYLTVDVSKNFNKLPSEANPRIRYIVSHKVTPTSVYACGPAAGMVVGRRVEAEPLVVYAAERLVVSYHDGPRSLDRVKAYSAAEDVDVLFIAADAKSKTTSKELAEFFVSAGSLEGAEVISPSEIASNPKALKALEDSKAKTLQKFSPSKGDPKLFFAGHKVSVKTLGKGSWSSELVAMGDLDENLCDSYLVISSQGKLMENGKALLVPYQMDSLWKDLGVLVKWNVLAMKPRVIAVSPSEAKTLRLEQQGYKNLVVSLKEQLGQGLPPAFDALKKELIPKIERVKAFPQHWRGYPYFNAGPTLGMVYLANTLGLQKVLEKLEAKEISSSVADEISMFYHRQARPQDTFSKMAIEVPSAWNGLLRKLVVQGHMEMLLPTPGQPENQEVGLQRVRTELGVKEEGGQAVNVEYLLALLRKCQSDEERLNVLVEVLEGEQLFRNKLNDYFEKNGVAAKS